MMSSSLSSFAAIGLLMVVLHVVKTFSLPIAIGALEATTSFAVSETIALFVVVVSDVCDAFLFAVVASLQKEHCEALAAEKAARRVLALQKLKVLRRVRHDKAATLLQSSFRAFVIRQNLKREDAAASLIQKTVRQHLASKQAFAATRMQALFRGVRVRQQMQRVHAAVSHIQTKFRCHFTARKEMERAVAAATVIQMSFRVEQARQELRRRQSLCFRLKHTVRQVSCKVVRVIQKWGRGVNHVLMKQLVDTVGPKLVFDSPMKDPEKEMQSALRIQTAWRTYSNRTLYKMRLGRTRAYLSCPTRDQSMPFQECFYRDLPFEWILWRKYCRRGMVTNKNHKELTEKVRAERNAVAAFWMPGSHPLRGTIVNSEICPFRRFRLVNHILRPRNRARRVNTQSRDRAQ